MRFRSTCVAAVCVAALAVCSVSAMDMSAGVKGGFNLARMYGDTTTDAYKDMTMLAGFAGGAAFQMRIVEMFAVQPEVLFSAKGMKYVDGDDFMKASLRYLEIPILLQLTIPAGDMLLPMVSVGPSMGIKLGVGADAKMGGVELTDSEKKDFEKEMNKRTKGFDFGLAMGLGLGIKAGPGDVVIDARYTLGFLNVNKLADEDKDAGMTEDDLTTDKNMALTFMAGYMFRF